MFYSEFIDKCRHLEPEEFEVHHIEPISIGGVDLDANKIKLSPKNHYIAHKLLALEHPYNLKLWQAWWIVYITHTEYADDTDYKLIRQTLENLPKAHSEEAKKHHSEATKRYMSSLTPEQKDAWRKKISDANKRVYSDPTNRAKLRSKGRLGKHNSPEHNAKISKALKGKPGHPNNAGRKWFTNGIESVMEFECPEGFYPGRIIKKEA